jgi:radical SAM protein with 4Fe4S-binding SPASM domain
MEKVIKKIANFAAEKRKNKATSIIFFGGEPLLNFECIKFTVEYFKQNFPELPVGYSLTTNGTVLTDEMIDFFEKTGFAVLVSLDGFDNEFNVRKYKNGKSSVQDVLNNIEKLRKINNVHLELRATLINTNTYICETYDFFEKLQIPFSIAFAYTSENKSHNLSDYNENNLKIIKQSFEKLTEYYKNKFINKGTIFDKKISTYFNTLRYRQKQNLPCGAGHGYMTIMSDGDIFTCPHFMNDKKYCIGNIDKPDIDTSKYSSVLISEISECQNCWAKYICNGHCVAQKISTGKANKMAMPENECNLLKIAFEHYLKLFYFAKKYIPEYFKTKEE